MSELRARVAALQASGVEVFDGPGLGLVEALLERAEGLGGGAGERLAARAAERLGLVEAAFARARDEVLGELHAMGEAAPREAREALERGDARGARRALRRARLEAVRSRQRIAVPWAVRLEDEARARGEEELSRAIAALCASGAVERAAHGQAVALGAAASSALLRATAESARATLAIARASDNLPETAGPYNGQVLAARTLAAMAELSPAYARAVVAAIDDLAALDARLGPVPEGSTSARAGGKSAQGRRRTR